MKLVTDSTCDLPGDLFEKHDVEVVPISILFGSDSYDEGIEIDHTTFYRKVDELQMIPKTSQPAVGRFVEVYRRLAAEGAQKILSIHCTSKLSGTYQSADMARQIVADEVNVKVFDSAAGSAGLGFMVVEAAQMALAGESVERIWQRLEELRQRMRLFFTVAELEYAQMSGRVGRLQGTLASILRIKPIVGLKDGVIDVVSQVRTRSKALDRMLSTLEDAAGRQAPINLAVIHAQASEEGQQLLERSKEMFNCRETFLVDLALSLAVQFGPGTLGIAAYQL